VLPRKLLTLLILVALGAYAFRSARVGSDHARGPAAPDSSEFQEAIGSLGSPRSSQRSESSASSDSGEAALREELPDGALARTGSLIAQVVEVDGCIDPAGTELILSHGGEEQRTPILPDGGALFENVRFEPGPTRFELRTSVADRRCFPESFSIDPVDLSGSPPSAGVSVALVHLHLLSGRVRDAASRSPIGGAVLEVDSFAVSNTVSDAGGAFQLNLPEPQGTLIVRARGYQELLWAFPEETGLGRWLPDQRDFELLPDRLTAWLEVKAKDESGRPAALAELCLSELSSLPIPQQSLAGLQSGERDDFLKRLEGDVNAFGRLVGENGPAASRLDEQGAGLIKVLVPGTLRVTVRQGTAVASAECAMRAGERKQLLLTLRPGSALTVRAVASGRPVQGVPLELESLDSDRRMRAMSDGRGRARFEGLAPSEEVVLELGEAALAEGAGWSAPALRLKLPDQERSTMPEVEFELQAERRIEYEGQVLDEETRVALEAHLVPERVGVEPLLSAVATDEDGRFRLIAPQGDRLLVLSNGYRERVVELGGSKEPPLEILLEPLRRGGTRLDLRLADRDGRALPSGVVYFEATVLSSDGQVLAGLRENVPDFADANGRVRHSLSLGPGERLLLLAAGETSAGDLKGRGRFELAAGQELAAELTLLPACAISGRVEGPDGGPARAGLQLAWQSNEGLGGTWASGKTDRQGHFRLTGLSAGAGRLVVQAHFHGALLERDLPPAGLRELVVRLEPLAQVELRPVDATTRIPLRQAGLRSAFQPPGLRPTSVLVPPSGRVQVRVSAPGYRPRTLVLSSRQAAGGPIEVPLERAW